MPSRERVEELISFVEQGKILEAIEEFYDDDVVMQENANPPTVGKAANRQREAAFGDTIAQVHENRAASLLVDGDRAAIHWIFDYTDRDGRRTRLDEIADQTWRGDKIVRERFYYDPTAPAAMADPAQAAEFIALNARYGIEMLPTIK